MQILLKIENKNRSTYVLLIALFILSSVTGKCMILEQDAAADTLNKVSMIFEVEFGKLNELDIKKHPVIQRSGADFKYHSQNEFPEGLLLSNEGMVTWYPTAAQLNELKTKPYLLEFSGHSEIGDYVKGQVRIISVGEVVIDTIAVDSTKVEPTPEITDSEAIEEEEEQPPLEPISMMISKTKNWDTKDEGETFNIEFSAKGGSGEYKFELIQPEFLMENLDPYGTFSWTPDFNFVSTDESIKSALLKIKVFDTEGQEYYESVPIYVQHVNRPPVVKELPTFYIQYTKDNIYQLKKDGLTFDPDGDSIIFKPVLKELPQGMQVSREGVIKWRPSRTQINYLRGNPMYLSFTVEDYPDGEKSIGQVKIEVSKADLPPEISMIPDKQSFEINEDDELNLNFFINDPNGPEDLLTFSFVTENRDIKSESLIEKDNWQYEFSWTPGYDFIEEEGEKNEFDISFYAIDKESNRTEKNILVTVVDTENILEKDRILYDQYRTVLERAFDMISQLNDKEKELEKLYRNAKKGKKNRAISTASLGALTGLSPIIFMENPDGQKVAAGLGGTATATIGTLEASNVIGEPPSDIMRDLNYVSQKRNDLLVYGNVFASKYALPVSKRDKSFQSDLRSLSIHLSLKDTAKLELDAAWENSKDATARNIKKIFKDFNKDERFEQDYK